MKPDPRRGIVHPAQVRLFHQHQLGVARLAAGEGGRQAQGVGEGAQDDAVGAADRRAEAGGGKAQHVGPGIGPRQHPRR